jgi:hypothetical protein
MNKVSMAPAAAAIHEAGLLQLGNEISDLGGHAIQNAALPHEDDTIASALSGNPGRTRQPRTSIGR